MEFRTGRLTRHPSPLAPLVLMLAIAPAVGCDGKGDASPAGTSAGDTKTAIPSAGTPTVEISAAPTGAPTAAAAPTDGPMGRVLPGAPLPFDSMLGARAPDVQRQLGEPLGKGVMRKSCVRHVPNRVWFRCAYAMQWYADKTGTFKKIGVQYEDGLAAAISWEPIPGTGPVDPKTALAAVGLVVPGEPSIHKPAENVTVWSYFNSATRLRLGGREYRVEVSSVDNEWANTKVELMLNDHLSEDEKSRVLKDQPTGDPTAPPAEPTTAAVP